MSTKARLMFVAVAGTLLLGAAQLATAGGSMDIKKHASMAPVSIPVPKTGTTLIGMTELELCTSATVGNGPTYALSSMNLSLTKTGTFTDSDIQSIRVFFEAHGGYEVYDNGTAVDDVDVLGAGGPFTFTGGTATIAIDPAKNTVDDVGNGNDHFYIVFELKSGALANACSIGCEVTSITYGNPPGAPAAPVPPRPSRRTGCRSPSTPTRPA